MMENEDKRLIMSATTGELTKALVKAQAKIKPIGKEGEVDFTHNGKRTNFAYALYADMWDMGHDALLKNGLDFSIHPMGDKVMGIMKHESGEYLGGWLDIKLMPNKYNQFDPKDLGEWVTYLSKYLYKAALNLPTDDNETMGVAKSMAAVEKAEEKKKEIDNDEQMYDTIAETSGMEVKAVKAILVKEGYDTPPKVRAKGLDAILIILKGE